MSMKWWRRLNLPHKCRVTIVEPDGMKYKMFPGDTVKVQANFDTKADSDSVKAYVVGTTELTLRVEE